MYLYERPCIWLHVLWLVVGGLSDCRPLNPSCLYKYLTELYINVAVINVESFPVAPTHI